MAPKGDEPIDGRGDEANETCMMAPISHESIGDT